MNRNARSRDIRVNEFSLPVICSAPLIHWHSFKWTHSVGVVSPWDLKLQRNSGVRTTQRFLHRIRCFDCFTRAPSIMISPWWITGRSDIFRPKRQKDVTTQNCGNINLSPSLGRSQLVYPFRYTKFIHKNPPNNCWTSKVSTGFNSQSPCFNFIKALSLRPSCNLCRKSSSKVIS